MRKCKMLKQVKCLKSVVAALSKKYVFMEHQAILVTF